VRTPDQCNTRVHTGANARTSCDVGATLAVHALEGVLMPIDCSAYETDAEAHAEVERLIAAGTPGERISVLTGSPITDHRAHPVGNYAGAGGPVGAFAGPAGTTAGAMGDYAGEGRQRRGSYSDADRDVVTTYSGGVRREHVASHRELERRLVAGGLDAEAAAANVAALHAGCVLIVVTPG
jgi:hypothetical protein